MLLDFLDVSLTDASGFPRLHCELDPSHLEDAATALAEAIAERRIAVNPRLHEVWTSRHAGRRTDPVEGTDLELLEASLLENIGTPSNPAAARHLHGLIAEAVWFEVIEATDAGLGLPLRIEGHDWSVNDPGGDGLTVYATPHGFCFRLWESKYHGTSAAVRETANLACRQLRDRSLSYLSRFSLIAQDLAGEAPLATFYGRLPELWVNNDPAAGVGINVAASDDADTDRDFDDVPSYFDLEPTQHQAALHLVADVVRFAETVRNQIWKGCGLWIAP
jgi:hypothetical protein